MTTKVVHMNNSNYQKLTEQEASTSIQIPIVSGTMGTSSTQNTQPQENTLDEPIKTTIVFQCLSVDAGLEEHMEQN